jgi:hypothetical protein
LADRSPEESRSPEEIRSPEESRSPDLADSCTPRECRTTAVSLHRTAVSPREKGLHKKELRKEGRRAREEVRSVVPVEAG